MKYFEQILPAYEKIIYVKQLLKKWHPFMKLAHEMQAKLEKYCHLYQGKSSIKTFFMECQKQYF